MASLNHDCRSAAELIRTSGIEWTSRAGTFASKYVTAAYLGTSFLALTIATSIAAQFFETINGFSRKL